MIFLSQGIMVRQAHHDKICVTLSLVEWGKSVFISASQWLILPFILSISNCVIFYPLVEKSFEVEDKSGSYAIAALYALADKEAPRAGNGGVLQKLNPGNAGFTLSWSEGTDDKTDAYSLRYKVYTSTSDNIHTVADIEANGELLTESTKSMSSLTISNLRIRGTVSYYNVIVQDLFGKKTAYSSISATIIPKYFYALNQSDNSVSIFTVNKTTGELTQINTLIGGNSPSSIYIPPQGNYLYMASTSENKIILYTLDANTGGLTFTNSYSGGSGVISLIADTEGRYLYSADSLSNKIFMFKINSTDGTLTPLTAVSVATGNYPIHLSIDPSGSFVYAMNRDSDSESQFVLNYTTGELTPLVVSSQLTGTKPLQAAIDPLGSYAFATNFIGNSLSNFKIDPVRGELKLYATLTTALSSGPSSLQFHPSGNYLYVAESTANQIRQMSLDRTNGILQPLATATVSQTGNPYYILSDYGGKFLYSVNKTGNSVSLYTIGSDGSLSSNSNYPTGNTPVYGVLYHTVE